MVYALALLMGSISAIDAEEAKFVDIFKRLTTANGTCLDRASDPNTVSCASTGFIAHAKAIAIERGSMDESESEVIRKGFRFTLKSNPAKNRGWLYHFTDVDGRPKPHSEVSTIDTAIFYFGHLRAAQILEDAEFEKEIRDGLSKIEVSFAMTGEYFSHGFFWSGDTKLTIDWRWTEWDEGVLLYRLFEKPFVPKPRYDFPLFVYYYPLCFFQTPEQIDALKKAVEHQKKTYGKIGITACDGPDGYQIGDERILSPLSVFAASVFSDLAASELKTFSVPRITASVCGDWVATDEVGIDFGSCYILTRSHERQRP